jgi:hypothetical protein
MTKEEYAEMLETMRLKIPMAKVQFAAKVGISFKTYDEFLKKATKEEDFSFLTIRKIKGFVRRNYGR